MGPAARNSVEVRSTFQIERPSEYYSEDSTLCRLVVINDGSLEPANTKEIQRAVSHKEDGRESINFFFFFF